MNAVIPTIANKVLSFGDFIKVLTTELVTQDPFSPFQTEDFINQMTSLQSYQAVSQLNDTIKDLQSSSKMGFAISLIGKMVALKTDNGGSITGLVNGVILEDNEVKVVVNNQPYGLDRVIAVTTAIVNGGIDNSGGSDQQTKNFN